jgi:hypothetical protein
MYDLAEMYEFTRAQDMYNLAAAVAIGFNDPENISKLMPSKPVEIKMEELPAMLRIPKRRG